MFDKISTIAIYAMPVATAIKGDWGGFSCWANFESPARPVETIVGAIVLN